MGQTIAEKILSRTVGKAVKAGDEEVFFPDLIVAYDYPGYIDKYESQMEELGIKGVKDPGKFLLVIDHFNPAGSPKEANIHVLTRKFAERNNIELLENQGIGHQIATELGYILPGMFAVHFDGHASTMGSLGALCMGISRAMIEAFATQSIALVVPPTTKIVLHGKLGKGVAARDLFHTILGRLGPAGCKSSIVEYAGEGLKNLNMDERMTICNLVMFLGGVTAIIEPDEVTYQYLNEHGVSFSVADSVFSDNDAQYKDVFEIDLSEVEPVLAAPPSPANTVTVRDNVGKKVNSAYLGSCASGRITDLVQACEILKGKKVAEGFRLHVVPTSQQIQAKASEMGLMKILLEAGAMVHTPTCDFCYGQLGVLVDGEVALSTGTLNIPGRMGSDNAEIYSASPYTIAASAITSVITDPRTIL